MAMSEDKRQRSRRRQSTFVVCLAVITGGFLGHVFVPLLIGSGLMGVEARLWGPMVGSFAGVMCGLAIEILFRPTKQAVSEFALAIFVLIIAYFCFSPQ